MTDLFSLSLADKLYRTRYEPDTAHPHITIDASHCPNCPDKPCLSFCPAEVYRKDPNDDARIAISHENCLECGTCRYGCPFQAIDWRYPDGGMGVKYRYG